MKLSFGPYFEGEDYEINLDEVLSLHIRVIY
jgi:hypothetical protein